MNDRGQEDETKQKRENFLKECYANRCYLTKEQKQKKERKKIKN